MRIATQLSVFLENRPGTLAAVCTALAQRGVNLLALSSADATDHAVLRIVPDKPDDAVHVLGGAGMLVIENEVVLTEIKNTPGALGELADKLARAQINIEYAYCSATEAQDRALLVLRTRDPQQTIRALLQR